MICYQYVTLNQIDLFFKRTDAWDQYERHSKCDYDQTKSLLMRNIYKNQTEIRCVNTAVIGLTCHQRVLFLQTVHTHKPHFVALHCQEVGGKNYEESMAHVDSFVK